MTAGQLDSRVTFYAPTQVQAAILLQLGELYRFRGDDEGKADREPAGSLSPMIEGILRRYRDPALA